MRTNAVALLISGLSLGCGEAPVRPPPLPCPDGSSCAGAGSAVVGGGGGGRVTPGDGGAADGGPSRYNVGGSVVVLDRFPPAATVARAPAAGWTVRAVDAAATALTGADGAFTLLGVLPTLDAAGAPVIGLRAVPTSRASFGAYREVRAGGGSATLETYRSERVLEAVAGQGGAPSADLGHVAVVITDAADPSVGVAGAVVDASSASTSFYDSDLLPGQLTPSVAGTGARGFALVLNVPAGAEATGGSVTLRVQVTRGMPMPSTVRVRVFPNTISWTSVRVVR